MSLRSALGSALAVGLLTVAVPARADSLSFTTNIDNDNDKQVITCADVDMSFWSDHRGDLLNVRRSQPITVADPGSGPLRLEAPSNGGVWVQPSADGQMTAMVCEVAAARSESAANALLDQVRIVNQRGELRVEGSGHDWGAYIILSVPKDVSLDMSAENGALHVVGVRGTFALHTTNGPIAIEHVSGKVTVRASNGPISFVGHEGDVDIQADNGPVKVNLDNQTWSGKGLDASTQNGPIKVAMPEGIQTGVRIDGSENSPLRWKNVVGNTKALSEWKDVRSLKFGDGPVLVRVSTVNGPITISGPAGKGRI